MAYQDYDFEAHEQASRELFRKQYSAWDHIKEEDMDVITCGDVLVGNLEFKIDNRLENYKIY